MSLNSKVGWFAGVSAATIAGVSFAGNTPGDTDARIANLESQIAALKAESVVKNWQPEEIRAMIQDAIADSETRTSLMASNLSAGYDKGFMISNEDGSFTTKLNLDAQFRFVWSNRDDGAADSDEYGFENRRTRLMLSGNLWDKDFKYNIRGAFGRDNGLFVLENAYADWNLGDGWTFRFGQFKAPFLKEELISSQKQQAVDRSYINAAHTLGYVQGIGLGYMNEEETFRFWAVFSDGINTPSTTLNADGSNTGFNGDMADFAFTARAEGILDGPAGFSRFDDYASWEGEEFGWLLGGAIHYQDGESGTAAAEMEDFQFTVDTQLEFGQANIAGAFVARMLESSDGATEADQYGFVVQGGVMFNPEWDVFARWEWLDWDDAVAGADEWQAITVGVNRYWHKHNLKWTNDIVFALDGVPAASAGLGLLQDAVDMNGDLEDNQLVFRSQLQFRF